MARLDGIMRVAAADDLKTATDQAMRRRLLEERGRDIQPASARWLAERLLEDDQGERSAGERGEAR